MCLQSTFQTQLPVDSTVKLKKVLPTWLSLFFILFPGLSNNIHHIFVSYGSSPSSTLLWCPQMKRKQMIKHKQRWRRSYTAVVKTHMQHDPSHLSKHFSARNKHHVDTDAAIDSVLSHQLSSPMAAVGRHADSSKTSSPTQLPLSDGKCTPERKPAKCVPADSSFPLAPPHART